MYWRIYWCSSGWCALTRCESQTSLQLFCLIAFHLFYIMLEPWIAVVLWVWLVLSFLLWIFWCVRLNLLFWQNTFKGSLKSSIFLACSAWWAFSVAVWLSWSQCPRWEILLVADIYTRTWDFYGSPSQAETPWNILSLHAQQALLTGLHLPICRCTLPLLLSGERM